ncbi:hypothetical protein BDV95DRAFT_591831 [Massariosphaeria phaeospora]|uniref:Extracellular membrane protein CFEM domain-containing protein n=1 Tax=Massariosphaeria phaeospora TaxID=100035 RepID=A0A7C8MCG5_9PLEO|nr:hypothetical protein BDV95DRAFT_591831 [Massariosphaeria phaeospora]
MRIPTCLAALAAFVAAAPHPQVEPGVSISATIASPTVAIPFSTSLNIPVTATLPSLLPTGLPHFNGTSTSRRRKTHWEPIPIFSKSCDCPQLATVAYPCWAAGALQRCNFEELHSFVCWTSANFGCPSPTRACSNLFTATPLTGRHPCEIGPNTAVDLPLITAAAVHR